MRAMRFESVIGRIVPTAILATTLFGCAGKEPGTAGADSSAAATTVAVAGTPQAMGAEIYQRCVSCHQANGEGITGTFPPLAGSEYATASNVDVPIHILLRGLQGPVTVKGVSYNGLMPPYGLGIEMTDEEVAAVLTHVRSSWGNSASAVTPQQVAAVRASKPAGPATADELKPMM